MAEWNITIKIFFKNKELKLKKNEDEIFQL